MAFIAALNARAQYTLTASSNPVAGDVYEYYFMDPTGVTGGSSGVAQIWDYSGLAPSSSRVTQTYTTVASTPSASSFPAANIASETNMPAGNFHYYYISATERSLVGRIFNSSNRRVNTTPVAFSVLPFSYGSSSVSNNFTGSFISSSAIQYSGVMTINAAGTGTLTLPGGQIYSNVLKIETIETYTLNNLNVVSTTTVCEWYSAASKFPLLQVLSSMDDNGSGGTFANKEVRMNVGIDVGLHEPAHTKAEFSIYPNPSQTEVFVDFETSSEKSYTLDIVDVCGSIVKQVPFTFLKNGIQHNRVDLSGLSAGTYVVKLRGDGKEGVRKLVIE